MKCNVCGLPLTLDDLNPRWLHVQVTSLDLVTGRFEFVELETCPITQTPSFEPPNTFLDQCYKTLASLLSEHHIQYNIYKQVPQGPKARFTLQIKSPRMFLTVHAKDDRADVILTNEDNVIKHIKEIEPGDSLWAEKTLIVLTQEIPHE